MMIVRTSICWESDMHLNFKTVHMIQQLSGQRLLENLVYAIIWLVIFAAPVIDFKYNSEIELEWVDVLCSWKIILPFFLLFLVNNFVLLPYLLLREKTWYYLVTILIAVAGAFLLLPTPQQAMNAMAARKGIQPKHENIGKTPPFGPRQGLPEKPFLEGNDQEEIGEWGRGPGPGKGDRQPKFSPQDPKHLNPPFWWMPFFFCPYTLFLMTVLLIVSINIAIKLLFKSLRDEQRMKELEKQTLRSELKYLKHQINPHFFMNTLNNIHALIDIDTEKAKSTVLELSKMMRYVLHESSQPVVSLEKEINFLENYIQLMKIRYTDNIDIRVSLPSDIPSVSIPPLLFISFIENAFKHGISYWQKSFIRITLEIKDDQLHCLVINSSFDNVDEQHQGIGLENVRKRLNLLYNDNYTLDIKSDENEYHVLLIIPIYP